MESLTQNPSLMAAAVVLVSYLIGAIPFGLIITALGGAGDVRKIGSGNIGATNVLRTGRKGLALATLVLDAAKGAVCVLLASRLGSDDVLPVLAGGAAFVGHIFPVWLGFRGGKGVATFFGVALAVAWPVGALAAVTWILTALLMRISSLAALLAVSLAPLYAFALGGSSSVIALFVVMGLLVILRHRENITRLRRGTEPRIGAGRA
ncbi:MAG: glycerol-3-phosphate 1-O-acyltransferase PlsY [Brevundimonas sp.]|uniref:glycerol-3-phosphate 1-O-acyltransferase PlsY n=1 Tax=Brevundimonas sp. TaxID=1871086 RepID=UPI0039197EAA